jgi:hypothetical protein
VILVKAGRNELMEAVSQIQCKPQFLTGGLKMLYAKLLMQLEALLKVMVMIVAANLRVKMAVGEVNHLKVDQVVLVTVVMRIVRQVCTTVVHLVRVVPVRGVQVKNLAKKVLVRVVQEVLRDKIGALVVNRAPNMAKNSVKAS